MPTLKKSSEYFSINVLSHKMINLVPLFIFYQMTKREVCFKKWILETQDVFFLAGQPFWFSWLVMMLVNDDDEGECF